jgi:hypothetical protein
MTLMLVYSVRHIFTLLAADLSWRSRCVTRTATLTAAAAAAAAAADATLAAVKRQRTAQQLNTKRFAQEWL